MNLARWLDKSMVLKPADKKDDFQRSNRSGNCMGLKEIRPAKENLGCFTSRAVLVSVYCVYLIKSKWNSDTMFFRRTLKDSGNEKARVRDHHSIEY